MKKILLTLIIISSNINFVTAQEFDWVNTFNYAKDRTSSNITSDRFGNTYSVVHKQGNSIKINDSTYTFSSQPNGYEQQIIIKTNDKGNVVWIRGYGIEDLSQSPNIYNPVIRVANDGSIYLISAFNDVKTFLVPKNSSTDSIINHDRLGDGYYVIKLNSSGYLEWLHKERNAEWLYRKTVSLDAANNELYFTYYDHTFMHAVKIASSGVVLADIQNPLSGEPSPSDINLKITYSSSNIVYILSRQYNIQKFNHGFVTKYDTSLNKIKSFLITDSPDFIDAYDGTSDKDGNIYVLANGSTSSTIAGFNSVNASKTTTYLMKADSTGSWKWIVPIYADSGDLQNVDLMFFNDKLLLSGDLPNGIFIDEYYLTGNTGFIAEINKSGKVLGYKTMPFTNGHFIATPGNNPLFSAKWDGNITINGVNKSVSGTMLARFNGLTNNSNIVKGKVFFDLDSDQMQDAGELGVPNHLIDYSGSKTSILVTNNQGKYASLFDSGTYIIKPSTRKYFFSKPIKDSITLLGGDSTVVSDFAMQPVGNINDLEIYLTNITAARPGFNVIYRVTAKNVGTTVLNSTIKLTYDSLFTFQNAGPPQASHTYPELTWSINNFKPGEVKDFTVRFTLASTANRGDTLYSFAEITPITNDTTEANNKDTLYQIIRGAYDPNIKEVNKPEVIDVAKVNGSFAIDYTIHFQNTGNDTAFHVYLIDSLDEDLKVQSIEVLSASHDYEMSISENNTLRWDYYNILLVDSNTNEPESHGFIKYRVWTKDNPGLGDVFTNFADIYFDFNAPVRTNTTTNRIDKKESVQLIKGTTIVVYPNPTNDVFTVKADIAAGTKATVEVIDLTGKVIHTENTQATTNGLETKIDINTLPQGIYFIKVYAGNDVYTAKVIKQ